MAFRLGAAGLRASRMYSSSSSNRFFHVADRKFNIMMILLVGAVSSELMWIIRTRNETERVQRNLNTEIKIMDRLIARINSGEKVDVEQELLHPASVEDVSLDSILSQIEEVDGKWKSAATKLPTAPKTSKALDTDKPDGASKGASSSSFL